MGDAMAKLRVSSRAAVMLLLVAAIWQLPDRARACTLLEDSIITESYPQYDETNVPTNVVLFVYGDKLMPSQLKLMTADGEPVAIRVEPAEISGFDITP